MSQSPRPFPDPDEPDLSKFIEQLLSEGGNPAIADALRQLGVDPANPQTVSMISDQLRSLFASAPASGGLNQDLAADIARKTVLAAGDEVLNEQQRRDVTEAVHVASLWLDGVTQFSAPTLRTHAWSRSEWVAETMPTWKRLVEPVALGVNAAIGSAMNKQLEQFGEQFGGQFGEQGMPSIPGLPPGLDLSAAMGQLQPMMGAMSSSMFGAQTGQAVGNLAGEVVTGTEVGLPIVGDAAVALLPTNIAAFAQGLGIDLPQVRLFLAVRESARVRLFADVPWLAPQVLAAVEAYARDISIDTEAIEETVARLDPNDLQAMQQALTGSLFTPTPSAAQQAALSRLETLLALIEGWVDVVAERATTGHLPQADALGEAVRRRRASGGPAEQLFSQLVGLELRPRRLRDAANLWAALEAASGAAGRDAAWAHPDVAPTATDLDDPLGYVDRMSTSSQGSSEIDAALEEILSAAERTEAARDVSADEGPTDAGPWPNFPYPSTKGDRSAKPGSSPGPSGHDEPGSPPEPEDGRQTPPAS